MDQIKDTILYVDDDQINLEVFNALLEDAFDIITVSTTTEAEKVMSKTNVKVLVSDQRMPEETGLSFLQRIEPLYPDIIKIVFTAYQDHETTLQAINQGGIFKFLLKPCNSKEIRITMENAVLEYNLRFENKKLLFQLKEKNEQLETAYLHVQENERKFRGIFENSNDGIIIVKDDAIVDANLTFLNIIGLNIISDQEQLNAYLRRLYPGFVNKLVRQTSEHLNKLTEIELQVQSSDRKYLELSSRKLTIENETYSLSIIRDITDRKLMDKRIIDAIIKTQEEDQVKYARELHDGLGPILSTLKMYIEWLADANNTVNKEKITEQSIRSINEAISIVKEIANNLSPHVLQRFGLVNAIQSYVDQVKNTVSTEFVVSSNITERLSPNIEISLYRIILESINNSLKHAKAQRVIIRFKKTDNQLLINYSDNGKGFDVEMVMQNEKGMGLYNMQNRVKSIGGEIRIKSNIDIGTDIEIVLNL